MGVVREGTSSRLPPTAAQFINRLCILKPCSLHSACTSLSFIAGLTRAGMIFVPSRGGLSHCPQEFSRLEDVALASEILLAAVIELAS